MVNIIRFITVILITHSKKYTLKERICMAIAWIPRASSPATLAGLVYNEAKSRGDLYKDYQ